MTTTSRMTLIGLLVVSACDKNGHEAATCTDDSDCAVLSAVLGACEQAACDAGVCRIHPRRADAACDDGDLCTENDRCQPDGSCLGSPVTCADDGVDCTIDLCDPAVGCLSIDDHAACEDGNPCTIDRCTSAGCTQVLSTALCDDGDSCTGPDVCQVGVCRGQPIAGCAAAACGDGVCSAGEDCGTCVADCSPVGDFGCGPECDPTAVAPCTGNYACVPSDGPRLALAPYVNGNGVCGVACSAQGDCSQGQCVGVAGLASSGICAASCDPAVPQACGDYGHCFARIDNPGSGICLVATPCADDGTCDCIMVPSLASPRVCMTGCNVGDAASCFAGSLSCLVRAGPEYHAGRCVGEESACSLTDASTCASGRRCAIIGGGPTGGSCLVCDAAGPLDEGELCTGGADNCGQGLHCDDDEVCRAFCDASAPACAEGMCTPVGPRLGRGDDTLGLCLPGCGDTVCAADESCRSCPDDCGACPDSCGDRLCTGLETCDSCALDCGTCPTCGDSTCNGQESCVTCPADCGACSVVCGDGVCGPGETCIACASDCGACVGQCGDGTCSPLESCASCAADCGVCAGACGDGVCGEDEDCGTCPDDCGLAGLGACGAACDPQGLNSCGVNAVCLPAPAGRILMEALQQGSGVCARGCDYSGECPEGNACLRLDGLMRRGLCGRSCTPALHDCPSGQRCIPGGDAGGGVCVDASICQVGGAECGPVPSSCVPVSGSGAGLCLPGCDAGASGGCSVESCVPKSGDVWHQGRCQGGSPCDPVAQSGCGATETCQLLAHPAVAGVARFCSDETGSVAAGGSCATARCAPGLVCDEGVCRAFCAPGGAPCASGTCTDASAAYGLPALTVGLCR